jgi:hypothetical protein
VDAGLGGAVNGFTGAARGGQLTGLGGTVDGSTGATRGGFDPLSLE